jgi:hypothetical protein
MADQFEGAFFFFLSICLLTKMSSLKMATDTVYVQQRFFIPENHAVYEIMLKNAEMTV